MAFELGDAGFRAEAEFTLRAVSAHPWQGNRADQRIGDVFGFPKNHPQLVPVLTGGQFIFGKGILDRRSDPHLIGVANAHEQPMLFAGSQRALKPDLIPFLDLEELRLEPA